MTGSGQNRDETFSQLVNEYQHLTTEQLDTKSFYFLQHEQYDRSLVCAMIAVNRFQGKKPTKEERDILSRLYNNIGVAYFFYSDYARAFNNFSNALEMVHDSVKAVNYNNIASLYYYYNDYDDANIYLRKAYANARKYNKLEYMRGPLQNLIDIAFINDSIPNLIPLIDSFIQYAANDSSPDNLYTLAVCRGMKLLADRQYHNAAQAFRQADSFTENLWNRYRLHATNNTYLAHCFWQLNRHQEAIDSLRSNLRLCRKMGYIEMEMDACQKLSHYSSLAGKDDDAAQYRIKYMTIKDSIFNAREFGIIKDRQFFREIDNYEKQVASLHLQARTRTFIILAAVIIIIITLLFLYNFKRKNKTLRQQARDLYLRINEQQQALEKQNELQQQVEEVRKKYQSSTLNIDQRQLLIEKINNVMNDPQVFCQPDFNIDTLAQLVGSNTKYVSQVINESLGKNFATLLAQARVKEAYVRLKDNQTYANYTLEAIANSLGFKSRSNFSVVFKNISGLTPKQYKDMAREEQNA